MEYDIPVEILLDKVPYMINENMPKKSKNRFLTKKNPK